jgi:hypothetical protein
MPRLSGPADEALLDEFTRAVTAPGAEQILERYEVHSIRAAESRALAERYRRARDSMDEIGLAQLRHIAETALPSHDEQFCSYWWVANIFKPLVSGELRTPPGLASAEERELLEAARALIDGDEVLQADLDTVEALRGGGAPLPEKSPYTVLWAIVDKHRFTATFDRIRKTISPASVTLLVDWATELATSQGVSCPAPS